MNPDKASFQYQKEFEVMSFQISPEGKLRWAALGDLLQEVAWKHADSREFGQQLFDKGLVWILSRFDIKVIEMPSWGDKILVKTAGRGVDKLFALREFQVEDYTGKILVNATSAWLLLDRDTKRPRKPEKMLPSELFKYLDNSMDTPVKVPRKENLQPAMELEVKPSDLDMNNHVNNVSFIRWIEDFCILNHIKISELLINYQAEVMMGEKIILSASQEKETVLLSGKQGGKEVFASRINK